MAKQNVIDEIRNRGKTFGAEYGTAPNPLPPTGLQEPTPDVGATVRDVRQMQSSLDGIFTPQSLEEDKISAEAMGIPPEQVETMVEKAVWDKPDPTALAPNMVEPEKAEPLAQGINAAKESGIQGGSGIIRGIFAGLAGAFSQPGKGVDTAMGLMDKWDPRTQEALRVKREGIAGRVEDANVKRQTNRDMNDATSDISNSTRDGYKAQMEAFNLPKLTAMFDGKNVPQMEKIRKDLEKMIGVSLEEPGKALDRTAKASEGGQGDNLDYLKYLETVRNNDRKDKESQPGYVAQKSEIQQMGKDAPKRQQVIRTLQGEQNKLATTVNLFKEYSQDTVGGTGPIATLGGLTTKFSERGQALDKAFKGLELDAVRAFASEAGARSMDSNAERMALTKTVPEITADDRANGQTFVGLISTNARALRHAQEKEEYLTTGDGTLRGFDTTSWTDAAYFNPDAPLGTPPQFVPKGSQQEQQMIQQGFVSPDDYVDYVTGDSPSGVSIAPSAQSESMSKADKILGL